MPIRIVLSKSEAPAFAAWAANSTAAMALSSGTPADRAWYKAGIVSSVRYPNSAPTALIPFVSSLSSSAVLSGMRVNTSCIPLSNWANALKLSVPNLVAAVAANNKAGTRTFLRAVPSLFVLVTNCSVFDAACPAATPCLSRR